MPERSSKNTAHNLQILKNNHVPMSQLELNVP